jgi:hypothetical protein
LPRIQFGDRSPDLSYLVDFIIRHESVTRIHLRTDQCCGFWLSLS